MNGRDGSLEAMLRGRQEHQERRERESTLVSGCVEGLVHPNK